MALKNKGDPMFTKTFLKDTAERVISTVAQTLFALLTVIYTAGGSLLTVDWVTTLAIAGTAGFLSLLKCVIAFNVGNENASLVK